MTAAPDFIISDEDLLRLHELINRRNSVALAEIEQHIKAVRLKSALALDQRVDVADIEAPEEPWFLEARVIVLEAELEKALGDRRGFVLPDLRKFARGKPCQMRLPGVCNGREETSVLCHTRRGGASGMGRKPCNLSAFIGCSECHAVYDRRAPAPPQMDRADVELAAFDAVCRTHELYRQTWGFL
jgi:hypothetical protein